MATVCHSLDSEHTLRLTDLFKSELAMRGFRLPYAESIATAPPGRSSTATDNNT